MKLKTYANIEHFELRDDGTEYLLGNYIQPIEEIGSAIDGEFDGWDYDGKETKFYLKLTPIKMSEKEYKNLPEFDGY